MSEAIEPLNDSPLGVALDAATKQFQRMPSSNCWDYARAIVRALHHAGLLTREPDRIEPPHPCDWDGVSYCAHGPSDGPPVCHNPAAHRRLTGMVDDLPLYEIVCCIHATTP